MSTEPKTLLAADASATMHGEPPFDGKPCPFCPLEVRHLHAVAHNFAIGAADTTIDDLRKAVELCEPLSKAHFENARHFTSPVAPQRFECMLCHCLWRLNDDRSWSLLDEHQKPNTCCDNHPGFLAVIRPV